MPWSWSKIYKGTKLDIRRKKKEKKKERLDIIITRTSTDGCYPLFDLTLPRLTFTFCKQIVAVQTKDGQISTIKPRAPPEGPSIWRAVNRRWTGALRISSSPVSASVLQFFKTPKYHLFKNPRNLRCKFSKVGHEFRSLELTGNWGCRDLFLRIFFAFISDDDVHHMLMLSQKN